MLVGEDLVYELAVDEICIGQRYRDCPRLLCGSSSIANVVAENRVILAQIKLSVVNDGMRPARAFTTAGGRERPDFDKISGVGFREYHGPIRVMQIQTTVRSGHRDRSIAGTSLTPQHISRCHLSTEGDSSIIGITEDVFAYTNDSSVLVREFWF